MLIVTTLLRSDMSVVCSSKRGWWAEIGVIPAIIDRTTVGAMTVDADDDDDDSSYAVRRDNEVAAQKGARGAISKKAESVSWWLKSSLFGS